MSPLLKKWQQPTTWHSLSYYVWLLTQEKGMFFSARQSHSIHVRFWILTRVPACETLFRWEGEGEVGLRPWGTVQTEFVHSTQEYAENDLKTAEQKKILIISGTMCFAAVYCPSFIHHSQMWIQPFKHPAQNAPANSSGRWNKTNKCEI